MWCDPQSYVLGHRVGPAQGAPPSPPSRAAAHIPEPPGGRWCRWAPARWGPHSRLEREPPRSGLIAVTAGPHSTSPSNSRESVSSQPQNTHLPQAWLQGWGLSSVCNVCARTAHRSLFSEHLLCTKRQGPDLSSSLESPVPMCGCHWAGAQ